VVYDPSTGKGGHPPPSIRTFCPTARRLVYPFQSCGSRVRGMHCTAFNRTRLPSRVGTSAGASASGVSRDSFLSVNNRPRLC